MSSTNDQEVSLTLKQFDKCKICGSSNLSIAGKISEFNEFFINYLDQLGQSTLLECGNCNFLAVSPEVQLTKDVLTKLYNIEYFRSDNEIQGQKNIYEKQSFLNMAKKAIGRDLNGLNLLDIGCGAGEYLKLGRELGMNVTGYDVDSSIAEYIAKTYGFKVVTGDLGVNTFEKNRFDVIVCSHVIEHLNDPVSMIQYIHKCLKQNGVLILTMPNPNAFVDNVVALAKTISSSEVGDTRLTPYTTPFHINGFSLKSTRLLLENNNFRISRIGMIAGFSWYDGKFAIPKKIIKAIGHMMGRGVAIISIAQKY